MLLIPIGDETPRERTPYVNYSLVALNVGIWLLVGLSPAYEEVVRDYGLTPLRPTVTTYLTSQFLHAGLLHLAGNMLYLWLFGDNVEDRMGPGLYAAFYLMSGAFAAWFHGVLAAGESARIPLIGASGAIAGVLGAYLVFFPHNHVKLLFWFWFYYRVFYLRAWIVLGAFFLLQFIELLAGGGGPVAIDAHIGGVLFGGILAGLYRFVVAPHRFGSYPSSDDRFPAELRTASRPSGPAPSALAAVPAAAQVAHADRTGTRLFRARPGADAEDPRGLYALMLQSDEIGDISRLTRAVRAVTSEPAEAVVRRIGSTRGLLARRLTRYDADQLAASLGRQSVPTSVVAETDFLEIPAARTVRAAAGNDTGIKILLEDGSTSILPWTSFILLTGSEVRASRQSGGLSGFIDLLGGDPPRIRVVRGRTRFPDRPDDSAAADIVGFREFAAEIIRTHGPIPINAGIRVLAGGGSMGYLRFDTEDDLDVYTWWLLERLRPVAGG